VRDQEQEVLGRAEAGAGGLAPPAPLSPDLQAAERHFAAGNFREARRLAEAASRAESEETRADARKLLERMAPDPLAAWLVAGCVALLGIVVWLFLLR